MRPPLVPLLGAALGLLASIPLGLPAAAQSESGVPTMPVADVRTGMKGYGLTVFRGTEPERFDVEVIGVLHNFRPQQDLVLIKTQHPRLDITHIVAGMSGSPVYLQNKMIGAYAYGWQFGAESVAGVTPIRNMLDDLARPVPRTLLPGQHAPLPSTPGATASALGGSPSPSNTSDRPLASSTAGLARFGGEVGQYDLFAHAEQLKPAPQAAQLTQVSTPLLIGGAGEHTARFAEKLFGPLGLDVVQAGGSGDAKSKADAPLRYVDGGAIGVQMISGDMSAMGLGTVTSVRGDKLVAFGHPMNGGGVSAMPTSIAQVVWILASQQRSFKMGEAVRPLGTLVNDRQSSIVIDTKVRPPTFPVTVHVEGALGAPHPDWSFQVAHDKFMSPGFVAAAVGNAIESTTAERRDVTWHAHSEVTVARYGTMQLDDFGVAVGGTPDVDDWAHSRAVRAVGAVLNNPWEEVTVERVHTVLSVRYGRESYRLRGCEAVRDVLDAGEPARVRLRLVPYAGPEEVHEVMVPIPQELSGKEVEIEFAPGYAEVPDLAPVERVADLVHNLPLLGYPPDTILASIKVSEQGVAYHGNVAPRLPPGAFDTLRLARGTVGPDPFISFVRTPLSLHRIIEGKDRVRVRVRPVLR